IRLVQKAVSWEAFGSGMNVTALLDYGYDANGNVTNIASGYANGVNLTYAYDPLNRLTNVLSHGQLAAAYSYDLAGNLTGMKYGNGVTNRYQYDSLNRLTNLVCGSQSGPLARFGYTLMGGGTRTNLVESINNGPPVAYEWSFDNLYRLTNENISTMGNVAYAYDAVGNRLQRVSTGDQMPSLVPSDSYSYDTNDELLIATAGGGNIVSNNYDPNGSAVGMATIGLVTNSYTYNDALNRIVGSTVKGVTVSIIGYDPDGNRVLKDLQSSDGNSDTLTYYLIDDVNPSGLPQVLEEYQGVWTNNGQSGWGTPVMLNRVYNYGLALISQQQFVSGSHLPGAISYYGYDGHGNVRFLMDTNGVVTDTYTYDAFGNLIASSGSTPNNYMYCGQQLDPDLGLYYNRARYFSTDVGRFWTMDTFAGNNEDPLSLHKYLYAEDNPVNADDPSGNATMNSILEPIASLLYAGINSPSLIGQAQNFISSLGAFTPMATGGNRIAAIVFGETATIVPQLKKGLTTNNGNPSNWDTSSWASLNGAREGIAEIANYGKRSLSPPVFPNPTTPVQTEQWQSCVYAAGLAQGKTSADSVFIWPSDDGKVPTKHPLHTGGGSWYYDYKPHAAVGPFRCVGGGDVPIGNNIYIYFYTGVPL
ncbi:MAG: RHS repeat-associated core domain-containing protein, partial [Limisphaerales bacterium]